MLHTGNDVKHIGYFTNLQLVEYMEVRQTGAARRYLHTVAGKFLQQRHRLGTFCRKTDAAVDKGNTPEIGAHLFQGFDEVKHKHVPQAVITMPHMG